MIWFQPHCNRLNHKYCWVLFEKKASNFLFIGLCCLFVFALCYCVFVFCFVLFLFFVCLFVFCFVLFFHFVLKLYLQALCILGYFRECDIVGMSNVTQCCIAGSLPIGSQECKKVVNNEVILHKMYFKAWDEPAGSEKLIWQIGCIYQKSG